MIRGVLLSGLLFGAAVGQSTDFVIGATSPGISSLTAGINLGHKAPEDTTWTAFLSRLGVNGARMFGGGGVGSYSSISTVGANITGWALGKSTLGTVVTTSAEFDAAVAALSETPAHTPKPAAGTAPAFALPWAAIDTNFEFRDNSGGVSTWSAGTIDNTISTLYKLGIEPLLVQQLGCSDGPALAKKMFTSTSSSDPTYWPERFEVYKHGYAIASWAWRRNISKLELANEPDFTSNNLPCFCEGAVWLDFFLVRALAAKNAYADLNSDLATGKATVANGLCAPAGCPPEAVPLNVLSSAYAGGWSTTPLAQYGALAVAGVCSSSVSTPYASLNSATAALYNQSFPLVGGVRSATTKNFQSFSHHLYGAGGAGLAEAGLAHLNGVKTLATGMQIYITEHARYTGAAWDKVTDNSDWPQAATRLGSQLVSVHAVAASANNQVTPVVTVPLPAGTGLNSYLFKFSMTPLNSGSNTNLQTALTSTAAVPKMQTGTGAGVTLGLQKHGIHYGDNNGGNFQPFSVADTTWSGEAAALIIPALVGGKTLYPCTTTTNFDSDAAPCAAAKSVDGRTLEIILVNDGTDSAAGPARTLSIDASKVPNIASAPGYVLVSEVTNVSGVIQYGEVSQFTTTGNSAAAITHDLPASGTVRISVPLTAVTIATVAATADTTINAGTKTAVATGGAAATLNFGTSATAVHDTTGAALIQFPTTDINAATTKVILKLTLATTATTPPGGWFGGGSHIFQVLGLGSRAWTEADLTWATATWLVDNTPTEVIEGINQNFYKLGAGTGNSFVGHISLEGHEVADDVLQLDITDYAKSVAGCGSSFTLAIVRRFRHNTACGNTANPCTSASLVFPADSLAGSTAATIYSKETAGKGPSLSVITSTGAATTPALTCSVIGTGSGWLSVVKSGTVAAEPLSPPHPPPVPVPEPPRPPPPHPPSPKVESPPPTPPSPVTAKASPPPPPPAAAKYIQSKVTLYGYSSMTNSTAITGLSKVLNNVPEAQIYILSITAAAMRRLLASGANVAIDYSVAVNPADVVEITAAVNSLNNNKTAALKGFSAVTDVVSTPAVATDTPPATVPTVSVPSKNLPPPPPPSPVATPSTTPSASSPASSIKYVSNSSPVQISLFALVGVLAFMVFMAQFRFRRTTTLFKI